MEERYAKFIDLNKEVRFNVPLVDVLASMPNYRKFLKDLVSNKSKMEQISTALNEEYFVIVQNKLPPKLGVLGSFLIPCTIVGSVEYLTLADLDAIINLMPYSLYALLLGKKLETYKDEYPLSQSYLPIPDGNYEEHARPNVIDEVTEEELDSLLDDSKPFSTMSEKISESLLNHEFEEFMAIKIKEILEQEEDVKNSFEVLPLEGNKRIKNSIQEPPTDLVMKPLLELLEYAFL
nr:reverse transcriptase domain-containing protein [Tanacetum cinerariifolium]